MYWMASAIGTFMEFRNFVVKNSVIFIADFVASRFIATFRRVSLPKSPFMAMLVDFWLGLYAPTVIRIVVLCLH